MTKIRKTAMLALSLCVLLIPAGCGLPGAASTRSQSAPTIDLDPKPIAKDWTMVTVDDGGLAISIPPGWRQFDFTKSELDQVFSEMRAANPQLASAMSGQVTNMVAEGVKLFAFDLYSASLAQGFANNVNVLRVEKPSDVDLKQAVKETTAELEKQLSGSLDGPILSMKLTTVGGQDLMRINYDAVINKPDGTPIPVSLVQYLGVTDNNLYILTGTTTTAQIGDYAHTFEIMAQSMYMMR